MIALVSEIQALVAISMEPSHVLPLAQRTLEKTRRFNDRLELTQEETMILEYNGTAALSSSSTYQLLLFKRDQPMELCYEPFAVHE
jgi:hypothetical protein